MRHRRGRRRRSALLKGKDFHDEQPHRARLALSLREELTDIQYGRLEDKHGWLLRLDA